jgi:hypothetical protein
MKIQLKNPIQFGSDTIKELTLADQVTVMHLKEMDEAKGEIGKIARLIGALSNQHPPVIDRMSAEDFTLISERLADFLPQSQKTSGT